MIGGLNKIFMLTCCKPKKLILITSHEYIVSIAQ